MQRTEKLQTPLRQMLTAAGHKSVSSWLRACDTNQRTLWGYVTGRAYPTGKVLDRMASTLNCTKGQVLDALEAERKAREVAEGA